MPIARVQLEDGSIARFDVPEGTTPDQVMQFVSQNKDQFAKKPTTTKNATYDMLAQQSELEPYDPSQEPQRTMMDRVKGVGEAAATIGTGMTTGLVGRAKGFGSQWLDEMASGRYFENPYGAADRIEKATLQNQSDYTYTPKTEAGQEYVQNIGKVGEVLAPLGPMASPMSAEMQAIASAKAAIPVVNPVIHSMLDSAKVKVATAGAKKLLKEASPTVEGIKAASRKIYGEIDDLGAVVNSGRTDRLATELQVLARKEGFNRRIHPKVNAALDEFSSIKGKDQNLTNIDTLRKVARSAASSIEPDEKRIGMILIDKIDDFLDDLQPQDFKKGGGQVGAKYRDARELWHRAKKAEIVNEAFEKAKNQASGFENGIRTQFRAILNNKKKLRGFTAEEVDAMRKIVRGGKGENLAKLIGKFGFSEGQASNVLMGSLGVAGGAAVGGPAGAVAVPLIGQVSKGLAQKLTRNNAAFLDAIVRAGKNGDQIVKEYMKAVPRSQRNAQELSELLLQAQTK